MSDTWGAQGRAVSKVRPGPSIPHPSPPGLWETPQTHALAQAGGEAVGDEVGLGLRHCAQVRDVVPHDHVTQREVGSGAEGQVADDEPH